MKRKIKFRGVSLKTDDWVYGDLLHPPGYFLGIADEKGNVEDVIAETVGQFTGLKDCKGNDIYEGDIIEFDRNEWGGDGNIHFVSWDEINGSWDWGGGAISDMEWRTVIGNIHDNKDLLK